MTISARAKAAMTAARSSSKAVWAFVAIEVVAGAFVLAVACTVAGSAAAAVDLTSLPSWRALAIFPVAGMAIQAARALNVAEVLRRWQGVAMRRIDERWGDEQ